MTSNFTFLSFVVTAQVSKQNVKKTHIRDGDEDIQIGNNSSVIAIARFSQRAC